MYQNIKCTTSARKAHRIAHIRHPSSTPANQQCLMCTSCTHVAHSLCQDVCWPTLYTRSSNIVLAYASSWEEHTAHFWNGADLCEFRESGCCLFHEEAKQHLHQAVILPVFPCFSIKSRLCTYLATLERAGGGGVYRMRY